MALSGQINGVFTGKPDTANRKPLITWSGTQSIAGNYTDITVNFIFWQASSTYYSYNTNASGSSSHLNTVNINGDTVGGQITTPYDTRNTSGNLTLRSHTVRVYHNQDGTKTCWIGWSGDTNTSRGTYNFGQTVTLNTIPRAASITSSADLTIGNNLSYTLKNDGSLYVKLQLHIWNGSSYSLVFDSNRGTGASGTVTLGTTENNIMYGAMPNNTNRGCVLRAYTYSDSGYTTQVGDYYDVVGTIYVNQTTNKPTFTTYTVGNLDKNIANTDKYSNVLVTSSTSTLLGADTKMIKGYSKLRAVITSANKMVALNSATSVKYRFAVGSAYNEQNYSASSTVNLDVDNATTNSVSVTAYDSRSLTTTVANSTSITNNANYVPVSLWGLTLTRDNGVDDGVKLAISGSYWKEYFGGGTSGVQNTITAHYRYKETTATWGAQTWNSLTLTDSSGALSFNDYIEGDLGASGFDTEKSFNIEVRIYDKLTNYILEGTLNVGTPVMDITSSGIALLSKYNGTTGGKLQIGGIGIASIDTDLSSVSANDDTLASAKAIKSYADTNLKYAYAHYPMFSAQSIPASTLTALKYGDPTTSDANILTLSNYCIRIDSRVKFFTIDISQSASQAYNYYIQYEGYGGLAYCTAQGVYFHMSRSWAGVGTDKSVVISVYGPAGTMTSDSNWNWVKVAALYI